MHRLHVLLTATVLAFGAAAASAADTAPPAQKDSLATAREHIAAKRWSAAIDELQRINATDDADWNNLMGYSLRKQKTPDLASAQAHYDAALRIAPAHRGALEYSGELYLMKGELAKAEERLTTLDKVCTFSCAEYRELKQAIERYKANGNQYVSAW